VKQVLITGANGFVGSEVCKSFIAAGFAVRGSVRKSGNDPHGIEMIETGDIDSDIDWRTILRHIDIVIHLAARVHVMKDTVENPLTEFRRVNVGGTEKLALAAAHEGVKRFVYISSIGAMASYSDNVLNESVEPKPDTPYGLSKLEAESVVSEIAYKMGMEYVIIRPPLVYGQRAPGNFAQLLELVGRGYPLPLKSIANRRSFIYLGNLADAIVTCACHEAAARQIYLVSDGDDVSTPELIYQLAAALGRPARLLPFPPSLIRLFGRIIGKSDMVERLLGSFVIDSTKIRRDLSWKPPFNMYQGLKQVGDWYLNNKSWIQTIRGFF
jgi:nucleoside-diphosphate-sugar epimerase